MEATCAPLLLGVFDSPCPSLNCSPYDNKIGGYPDFYSIFELPSCPVCGSVLALLVQVYCPLENTVYHRTLHIFCCVQPSCHRDGKGWLVLRSQLKDEPSPGKGHSCSPPANPAGLMSAEEWCGDADDWGSIPDRDPSTSDVCTSSTAGITEVRLDQRLEQLTLNEVDTSPTTNSDFTAVPQAMYTAPFYPPGYLRVVEEDSEGVEIRHARDLLKKYQSENPDIYSQTKESTKKAASSSRGKHESDAYEKATPKHGDRAFQKFHKQVIKCPQQLLRYHRGGEPLLITDNQVYKPPSPSQIHCRECGALCVFELQLMPTLIYVLQTQLEQSHNPDKLDSETVSLEKTSVVEFGTVLVYTCSKSCWTADSHPRTETVFVQMDKN